MKIVDDAEKQIEQQIYEFVYRLASSAPEVSKEFSYYYDILSRDHKFESVVKEIYENRLLKLPPTSLNSDERLPLELVELEVGSDCAEICRLGTTDTTNVYVKIGQ
jgi:hypothetical protein